MIRSQQSLIQWIAARKKIFVISVIFYTACIGVMYQLYIKSYLQRSDSLLPFKFWNGPHDEEHGSNEFLARMGVDIHLETPDSGHAGEVAGGKHNHTSARTDGKTVIAIGGGITSKGVHGADVSNMVEVFQLFSTFLPSFCATADPVGPFSYQFYFAYDHTDPVFTNTKLLDAFQKTFFATLAKHCPRTLEAGLHFVQCSHSGKPTWAQNDAMMEAYLDDADFHYRINDDTKMESKNWLDEFIKVLKGYKPINVGVVGPNHSGGNTAILTYDFVHSTHVDIFGYYYPKLFTDWWGDDWITIVYRPDRSTKLEHIRLAHTLKLGQRYKLNNPEVGGKLGGQLEKDKKTLARYISHKASAPRDNHDVNKVISMSLYGKEPKYIWGAIRNAQLMKIFFPDWKLRIYTPAVPEGNASSAVPERILQKLKTLGSEIVHVKTSDPSVPLKFMRYLVSDDPDVEFFLIRDADGRISGRDAATVDDWMKIAKNDSKIAFHCIRDHPKHANVSIVDGLWGGRTKTLKTLVDQGLYWIVKQVYSGANKADILRDLSKYISTSHTAQKAIESNPRDKQLSFLKDVLWSIVAPHSVCHDSVSPCDTWNSMKRIPVARDKTEYIGQKYDERHELVGEDSNQLDKFKELPTCNTTATTAPVKVTLLVPPSTTTSTAAPIANSSIGNSTASTKSS